MNNSTKPQDINVPHSDADRAIEIIRKIPVHPANFDYISKRQYGINGSLAQDIKYAMKEYAVPLQSRISELEAKVKEYEEALTDLVNLKAHKEICGKDDHYIKWQPKVWQQAQQALKSKEEGNG